MTRAAAFTAEIVRATSRGLAGVATAALYERLGVTADSPQGKDRSEEVEARYGTDGFEVWRQSMSMRLLALASALEVSDVEIFADDIDWFRGLSTSRSIPIEDVAVALDCLEETVAGQLPTENRDLLSPYFQAARATSIP